MGLEKAIEWANQFPVEDQRMRETILGQMGARLARQDIAGTAQWVESMKGDKASLRVMDNLLNQWASKDASSAAKWLNELPSEDLSLIHISEPTRLLSIADGRFGM